MFWRQKERKKNVIQVWAMPFTTSFYSSTANYIFLLHFPRNLFLSIYLFASTISPCVHAHKNRAFVVSLRPGLPDPKIPIWVNFGEP
jgi:hypothetical protein